MLRIAAAGGFGPGAAPRPARATLAFGRSGTTTVRFMVVGEGIFQGFLALSDARFEG
jgi:hypothetical protein